MTIKEIDKLLAEAGTACRMKYPHGVFVNPSTICGLLALSNAPRGTEGHRAALAICDLDISFYPL